MFCSGSNTSSSAEAGSPFTLIPITLSISSRINTGFDDLAFFMFCIIRPGIAPMYVLRCPRISASSLKPPNAIRTYLRLSAEAIDFPREVFPTPGGPTKHSIGDFMSPFNLSTARYSNMRSFTFSIP